MVAEVSFTHCVSLQDTQWQSPLVDVSNAGLQSPTFMSHRYSTIASVFSKAQVSCPADSYERLPYVQRPTESQFWLLDSATYISRTDGATCFIFRCRLGRRNYLYDYM